jgi:death on curing protein
MSGPKIIGYIYLDVEDVLAIHDLQIAKFGGASGIRDSSGIASAVAQPQQTYAGEDLYEGPYLKAAVLAHGLAESQCFIDGNKRTALTSALTFLKVNGQNVPKADDRLYEAMIGMAKKEMTKEELADCFRDLVVEFNAKLQIE